MLIIPFDRKIDWSRPPVVTLLLILANLLAFFIWQGGEDEAWERAIRYYADSGLAAIEYPLYRDHLTAQQGENPLRDLDPEAALRFPGWVAMLQLDRPFMDRLQADQLVVPDSERYREWKRKRRQFESLYLEVTYIRYGWRTALPDPASLFGHMFLHAGLDHLLGNMFFLFAVGFLVEATLGRWAYLIAYLLSGLGSAGFDILFTPGELIPGIGASGAISGLMGMYAVLYWTRSIRFFYFLIIYFDYVKLPAIALLPLWLGNELFQLVVYAGSGVNYLAHLGGLCTGALLGVGARKLLPSYDMAFVEEEDKQQAFETRLEEARDLCRQLEYRRALSSLRHLARQKPENREVLYYLRQCCRLDPASEEYHGVSRRILELRDADPAAGKLVEETFRDYLKHARPAPRIGNRLALKLAYQFSGLGNARDTEVLVRSLLKKGKRGAELEPLLERLVGLLEKEGESKKMAYYRAQLHKLRESG